MRNGKIASFVCIMICAVMICATGVQSVSAKTYKHSYNYKAGTRGEYDAVLTGKGVNSKKKPKVTGKGVDVRSVKWDKKSSKWRIQCGIERNKVAKVAVSTSYKNKISCRFNAHLDKYSNSKSSTSTCMEWVPNENSKQPYTYYGQYTKQVLYLNSKQAAIYSMGLTKNKYLKLLDKSISFTAALTKVGISPKSALGKKVISMGRSTTCKMLKNAAEIYGWKALPEIGEILQDEANKTTHGYKDGLKITVTWTLRGGFSDSYAAWNQRKNTIQGQRYIRGEFHKTTRVKGWY